MAHRTSAKLRIVLTGKCSPPSRRCGQSGKWRLRRTLRTKHRIACDLRCVRFAEICTCERFIVLERRMCSSVTIAAQQGDQMRPYSANFPGCKSNPVLTDPFRYRPKKMKKRHLLSHCWCRPDCPALLITKSSFVTEDNAPIIALFLSCRPEPLRTAVSLRDCSAIWKW